MSWKFEKHRAEIIQHAEEAFPEECVGAIVDGQYVRLKNADPEPEEFFALTAQDEQRLVFGPEETRAQAIVHSHPVGPLYPTGPDMKAYVAADIPFVFVGHHEVVGWDYWELGDHLLDLDLNDRIFRHGVTDCFSALRSWFWQRRGLKFPDIARRDDWWFPVFAKKLPDGEPDVTSEIVVPAVNLYADHFEQWGFRQLSTEEIGSNFTGLKPGDVFLHKLNRAYPGVPARSIETHGGVYDGDGRVYHHLPGRQSSFEAAEGWAAKASRWIRYEGEGAR